MRYLKLFESFREEFYKSVNDLQSEYESNRKKLFSDAKAKVDEFMFDLTDDFSDEKTSQQDFIEEDWRLSVWYHLKCDECGLRVFGKANIKCRLIKQQK